MNIKHPEKTDITSLRHLWKEVFGDTDEFVNTFFETAFDTRRAMIVKHGSEVAGALYWFSCECEGNAVAYIYGVSTAVKYQRQGVCHKLMEYTHNHLREEGYKCAVLVPGSRELFDFYKGIGYEVCSYISEVLAEASASVVQVYEIDKNEYRELRRRLIPPGGVLQENETLDFLEKQVKFYGGDDFVLAGRKDGECFFGIEFLGDTSKLSGIVKNLHCNRGSFRVAGADKPFSMWILLEDENGIKPRYFGLALD